MQPVKDGRSALIASAVGRWSLRATTRPSASSVSRSSPQRTVNRYSLRPSITNGTVLVASPSAIGSAPEASGSSVPAWPARLAVNSRLMTLTAWVEVMPTGLSSATQPCTSRLSRLNCCLRALGGAASAMRASSLIAAPVAEIARHRRRAQQLVDALGFGETLVDAEAQIGRKFQIDTLRD